jgi:hypothetical protein
LKFLPIQNRFYHENHELFNMYWGKMYSQQITLCRFGLSDMVIYPDGLPKQVVASRISQMLATLDQSSTKLMDMNGFLTKRATTNCALGLFKYWPLTNKKSNFQGFQK